MTQDGAPEHGPLSASTGLRRDTMLFDTAPSQAEAGLLPADGQGGEWVLRAPCGSAVLDPAVSPADAARVLALLREIEVAPVPRDSEPQQPQGQAPSEAQPPAPRRLETVLASAPSAGSGGSAGAGDQDGQPGEADTRVWLDPDDMRPLGEDLQAGAPDSSDGDDGQASPAPSTPPVGEAPVDPQAQPGGDAAVDPGTGYGRRSAGPHAASPSPSSASEPTEQPAEAGEAHPGPAVAPKPPEPALVRGWKCVAGHMNPEGTYSCLLCAQPVTMVLVNGPRPALVSMVVSTGEVIEVNGTVVVGRAPKEQGEPAQLVTVPSPTHLVSRSHLLITTTGWTVLARDLGSSNGTVLVRPGQAPVLIATALPTPLVVGDLLDIGDGMTLRIDAPTGPTRQ